MRGVQAKRLRKLASHIAVGEGLEQEMVYIDKPVKKVRLKVSTKSGVEEIPFGRTTRLLGKCKRAAYKALKQFCKQAKRSGKHV